MTVRIDTEIALYSPTAPPGAVGDADSHLSLAGQARPDPYHLEGARVVVRGSERAGVASVVIDGATAVEDLVADAGLGVNVVVAPALVRRECVGARGNVMETALALPTLPMAAFQWSTETGLEMSFTVLPDHDDLRYHLGARTLRAEFLDPSQGVDVLIHPEPEEWRVVEGPDGGLHVHVVVTAPGPVTLLVASGAPGTTARALDAGRHLAAHATRSATDHDPTNVEALLPVTGVAEIDGGVGWATVRLGGVLLRGDPRDHADWFWTGVGALASGDEAGALQAADRLRGPPTVSVWGTPKAAGPALATFLTARATLLSGNEAPAQRALEHLGPEGLEDIRAASDPDAWAWWALALTSLADALRYGASEAEVQALRDLAATPAGRPSRVLPMAGSGPRPGSAPWLRALLRGEGLAGTGPVHEGTTAEDPLTAWITLAAGDVEGGYGAWRAILTHGLSGIHGPRGSWRPPAGGAAGAVSTLAFGLLGLEPDAPSGRIRVAPVLPAHMKQFRVRGIRVGDARLELSYQRADGTHRFHLNALDGRVPPMVILEPSLPIAGLLAVRVDGAPAEITSEPHAPGGAAPARTRLRVQIPLDGPRVLEVDEG